MAATAERPRSAISYDDALAYARETPLEVLDPARWDLFEHDVVLEALGRMRREAPVHLCPDSVYGPYWSVTRWQDIRDVELDPATWSSDATVTLLEPERFPLETPSFITMDGPEHDHQRRIVRPSVSRANLRNLEPTIRERAGAMLDALPVGDDFDWVDRVSIELTTQMLATLFDFPFEERRKLTWWSNVMTGGTANGVVETKQQRKDELLDCLASFQEIWDDRAGRAPANDLISMLAHAPETADMHERPMELLGNVMLLIVGGNDTTRNSITGGVLALNRFPDQFEKLRANPDVIPNLAHEIVRWQTPLAYMRRTATKDTELGGRKVRAGDKLAMWYLAANYDEDVFPDGEKLLIDRPNAKANLSFGFGTHRCMGEHLALMQLRVLWEEILARFSHVEVVSDPIRTRSSFVRGYQEMRVRVHPK